MNEKIIARTERARAYYSGFGGIEIFNIMYTPEGESVIYTAGSWTAGEKTYHQTRIYYNKRGDAYFLYKGNRVKLSECIRI